MASCLATVLMRCSTGAVRKPTSFTPSARRRVSLKTRKTSNARRSLACCGRNSSITSMCKPGSTAIRPAHRLRTAANGAGITSGISQREEGRRGLLSLVNRTHLVPVLRYLLDESEFLSPYGIRAISRFHKDHLVSHQFSADRSTSEISSLLWRRINGRAADRFQAPGVALGGRRRDFAPADAHFPAFRRWKAPRLRRTQKTSERSLLVRPHLLLRVLPWRQRGGDRGKPSDRMDGTRGQAY